MSSSSRRRNTTNVVSSPKQQTPTTATQRSVHELDRRAVELEKQLATIEAAPSSSATTAPQQQEQANGLRVQICELLADVILTDPKVAVQRHVLDRLWRKCFYARLSKLRSKLSKEQKKRQNKTSSTSSLATALEQHLLVFLSEAITLYDYICQMLWDKLKATAATTASSSTTSPSDDKSADALAIVECLHRLYLCLGDLHRYSTTSTTTTTTTTTTRSAEASYLTSSKLGPGYGHPLNQLGVLCGSQVVTAAAAAKSLLTSQTTTSSSSGSNTANNRAMLMKAAYINHSALGLYWYVRALCTSKEPFETTHVNMGRLFQANFDWLQAIAMAEGTQGGGNDSGTTGKLTSAKSQQSSNLSHSASLFLAKFVQLHSILFQQSRSELDLQRVKVEFDEWHNQVSTGFQTLLNHSTLGDSLLQKLVCIQAFSEWYNPSTKASDGSKAAQPSSESSSRKALVHYLARIATLTMGIQLVDRFITVGQKSTSTSATTKPSIRLLTPMWLLIKHNWSTAGDYHPKVSLDQLVDDAAIVTRLQRLSQEFAINVVQAMNLMATYAGSMEGGMTMDESTPPKELLELRGFVPFASFLPDTTVNGYATAKDALDVLISLNNTNNSNRHNNKKKMSSNDSQTSQDTSSVSSFLLKENSATVSASGIGPDTQQQEYRWKVARFLALAKELVDGGSAPQRLYGIFRRTENGLLAFDKAGQSPPEAIVFEQRMGDGMEDSGDADYDDDGGDDLQMYDDDDQNVAPTGSAIATTVLIYQENKSGGPALLVPGAFLPQPESPSVLPAAPSLLASPSPPPAGAPIPVEGPWASRQVSDVAVLPSSSPGQGFAAGPSAAVPTTTSSPAIATEPRITNPGVPTVLAPMDVEPAPALPTEAASFPVRLPEPSAAVLPPPGFGRPANANAPSLPLPPPTVPTPYEPIFSNGLDSLQAPSTFGYPSSMVGMSSSTSSRPLSVLESLHMFDDPSMTPPTSNPFVPMAAFHGRNTLQESMPAVAATNSFRSNDDDNRWMQDVLGYDHDATNLLDSGLLSSLMHGTDENPPKTNNPFAT